MSVIIDGTDGITTPELDSSGPVAGTTANFSGNVTLGSSVLATPTGSAPSYTCRAWVNFNGTGTVAIREDGNVSSITDNGTGDYTVNFTTAMPDANFSVIGNSTNSTGVFYLFGGVQTSASSARVYSFNTNLGGFIDVAFMQVAIFR